MRKKLLQKQLLESIGLYDTNSGALTQPIEFTYLTNNSDGNVKIAEAIQADLSTIGINLKIDQQEWNVFLNARKEGQFDFAREGWLMDLATVGVYGCDYITANGVLYTYNNR